MRVSITRAGVLVVAILTAQATPLANAATIKVQTTDIDGQVVPFITVDGEFVEGDEDSFADAAIRMNGGAVLLSSPGGNVRAGIEIGKAIRLKGFATLVVDGVICASACALAWLGGRERYMASGARVGFHAVTLADDPNRRADSIGNALVGAYLNQLGLPSAAIAYISEAQPNQIRWLTFADARSVGIDVKALSPGAQESAPTARQEQRPAAAPPESWASYGEWIQIFSRAELSQAIALASEYDRVFPSTLVFRYDNDWYVVVIGPYVSGTARAERDRLVASAAIPDDSFVTEGARFVELEWGGKPSRPALSALPPQRDPLMIASGVAKDFFRTWSSSNVDAFSFLSGMYSSEVGYFGKPTSRGEVLHEKALFIARWPERTYTVAPGMQSSCRSDGTCVVTGVVDWRTYSAARNTTSEGRAKFTLTIATVDPIRILAESSEVLSRQIREGR